MSHGGNKILQYDPEAGQSEIMDYLISSFGSLCKVDEIKSMSFALVSEVMVEKNGIPIVLLGDSNLISKQYSGSYSSTKLAIYPLAFSSSASNWQSKGMPLFYQSFLQNIMDRMDQDNGIADECVLQARSFQGYSTIKQQIRPSKAEFPFGHSVHTGVHCMESSMLTKSGKDRHNKLGIQVENGKAFDEINGALDMIDYQSGANYRFEPVVTINIDALNPEHRTLEYISEMILVPMVEIWHKEGIKMSRTVLCGHSYEVSPWARPAYFIWI
jgi:hypothetical protein